MVSAGPASNTGAWLITIVLALAFTLSVVDRYVIAYVMQDIKRDLGLSDFEIGLLQGFAFSLIFATASLPLGNLVDRLPRIRLVAAGIAVWSAMTLGCGLARGYWSLALFRAGVGTGEAALTPAAYSILSDAFPPRHFFIASSIFSLGPVLAVSVAGALSAAVFDLADADHLVSLPWFGATAAWRVVFLLCGLLALPLLLIFAFLREPPRARSVVGSTQAINFRDFLVFLKDNWRVHLLYCLATGMTTAASYALNAWMPATLTRELGWTSDQLGSRLAGVALISGLVGCAIAGGMTTFLSARGRTSDLFLCIAIAAGLFAVAGVAVPFMNIDGLALPVLALAYLLSPFLFVLTPSLLQILTPPEFRGRMSAVFLLLNVGVGAGLGPALVGAVSSLGGEANLPLALGLTIATLCAVAAVIILLRRSSFATVADRLAPVAAGA